MDGWPLIDCGPGDWGMGMPDAPTGTVTFLFSDIEGSTRLWEEHQGGMQSALQGHDRILRASVESHGGHVVKLTGDGVHAVFAGVADAVRAALDVQRRVGSEEWSIPEPLRVRIGVHTGEAEHRDGDYYGPTLNRAARLMAVANGGQVLVSLATEELVRDRLPTDAILVDLGEHRLRDLARPEQVFEVRPSSLEVVFPPLRTLDAYPGNLPLQLTSFVGRDEELGLLDKALDESRLLTLTGVGGVGKTRLAIQVAAEVLPRFPDGAWLCELAAATDPEALGQVVAATLGVTPRPGVTLEESVVGFLRPKRLLVVLDNCEHLLAAAGDLVENILRSCPGVRVVATSREGLGIVGEQVWPLRSLRVPRRGTVGGLAEVGAVQLFVDRARSARPGFVLDGANGPAVGEICRRLDGMPLAIELAAARVEAMSAPEIAELLDERFRLLTGGRRTAVERHQTLRAAVDWSYSLLANEERLVFDRLGVFAGTFDAAAATAVVSGGGVEAWDVRDAIGALVAKSLVVRDETPAGVTRYMLLETLRQYARERLDEQNETDTWRRRHAQHYAAFAEEAGPSLLGPQELTWRPRVGDEIDNLRAAVLWSLDASSSDDVELAIRIIAPLGYESTMRRSAGIAAWAETATARLEATTPGRRAAVLGAAAFAAFYAGEYERVEELARAALDPGIPADCPAPNTAIIALGLIYLFGHEPQRAIELMLEAQRDAAEHGWATFDVANLHATTATWAILSGNLELGKQQADEALRLARQIQNPSSLAIGLYHLGWAIEHDDPAGALDAFEQSVALTREGASDVMLSSSLTHVAWLSACDGDTARAVLTLREALTHAYQVGDRPTFLGCAAFAAMPLVVLHEPELALWLLDATTRADATVDSVLAPHEKERRAELVDQARGQVDRQRLTELEKSAVDGYESLAERLLEELEALNRDRIGSGRAPGSSRDP